MDFIERWFGISPDGGDGSTEALFLLVIVIVLALVLGRRWIAGALWRRD